MGCSTYSITDFKLFKTNILLRKTSKLSQSQKEIMWTKKVGEQNKRNTTQFTFMRWSWKNIVDSYENVSPSLFRNLRRHGRII